MSPGRSITCSHVLDLLDDYRRGKLLPGQLQVIADHLERCPECHAELDLREAMARQMLAALPPGERPVNLSPAIRMAIAAATRDDIERDTRKSSSLLPVILTAAILVITVVAIYQVRNPLTLTSDATIARTDEPHGGSRFEETDSQDKMKAEIPPVPQAPASEMTEPARALNDRIDSPAPELAKAEAPVVATLSAPRSEAPVDSDKKNTLYSLDAPVMSRKAASVSGTTEERRPASQDTIALQQQPEALGVSVASRSIDAAAAAPMVAQSELKATQSQKQAPPAGMAGFSSEAKGELATQRTRFYVTGTTASLSTSTLATTVPSGTTTPTALQPQDENF